MTAHHLNKSCLDCDRRKRTRNDRSRLPTRIGQAAFMVLSEIVSYNLYFSDRGMSRETSTGTSLDSSGLSLKS